jgi:copper chaperone CopZ
MSQNPSPSLTSTFDVSGMTCGCCESHVRKAVEALPGVRTVLIEPDSGHATVDFDSELTGASTVARAITAAGYPARELPGDTPAPRQAPCGCGCR